MPGRNHFSAPFASIPDCLRAAVVKRQPCGNAVGSGIVLNRLQPPFLESSLGSEPNKQSVYGCDEVKDMLHGAVFYDFAGINHGDGIAGVGDNAKVM